MGVNDPLQVTKHLLISASDLDYQFSRSGGPGGQHVNTTETRVQLRFRLPQCTALYDTAKERLRTAHPDWLTRDGDLLIACSANRSRMLNIEAARERLAQAIRQSLKPPKKRHKTKPTRSSQRRRVDAKKRRSSVKKGRGRVDHD